MNINIIFYSLGLILSNIYVCVSVFGRPCCNCNKHISPYSTHRANQLYNLLPGKWSCLVGSVYPAKCKRDRKLTIFLSCKFVTCHCRKVSFQMNWKLLIFFSWSKNVILAYLSIIHRCYHFVYHQSYMNIWLWGFVLIKSLENGIVGVYLYFQRLFIRLTTKYSGENFPTMTHKF